MINKFFQHPRFQATDERVTQWMEKYGHYLERKLLGILFIWFGLLKCFGHKSATSIIAQLVYWAEPEIVVPLLGIWETLIGVCLIYKPFVRIAILLLFLRLPGTFLSLIINAESCFHHSLWVPTIQGQYLLKDLILIGAALVIGSTVRWEKRPGFYH